MKTCKDCRYFKESWGNVGICRHPEIGGCYTAFDDRPCSGFIIKPVPNNNELKEKEE